MIKALLSSVAAIAIVGCAHSDASPSAPSVADAQHQRVLVILSGSDYVTTLEGKAHQTGYFLSELAGPVIALENAGFEIVFTTPAGLVPSMDPISDDLKWFRTTESYQQARNYIDNAIGLKAPRALDSLTDVDLAGIRGVFVPGGHAPIEDLSHSREVSRVLEHFHRYAKPTGLICHGLAALLSAKLAAGWLYAGYRMTGFSAAEEQQEEDAGHLDGHMPFYPETALRRAGGLVNVAAPWTSMVIRDRELITGQNPQSEEAFTKLFLAALVN